MTDHPPTSPPPPQQPPPQQSAAPQQPTAPQPQGAAAPAAVAQGSAESEAVRQRILAVRNEVAKVVVGQDAAFSGLVGALLVGGHVLVEGVPGVAKTLLVKTMAQALNMRFTRLQFTPDLMPSDVVGQTVYNAGDGTFTFRPGPVFTNFLLADEINRTPPKTQSSLLEAMEEGQVSTGGKTYALPEPFITVATQNPVEYEGTYPLPEAQLDRFAFKLVVDYPTADQEYEVISRHHRGLNPHDVAAAGVRPVAGPEDLLAAREMIRRVNVEDRVVRYIVDICRATRDSPSLSLGVSPRGAASLLHASKAWAWLSQRPYVSPDEVKAVAYPALRHRMALRPELELDGMTTDSIIDNVLATVPAPR